MAVLTCCCGCSLRAGVQTIGVFYLIASAISIYQQYRSIQVYKDLVGYADENLPFSQENILAIRVLGYVYLVFGVISLLATLLLLGSCGSGDWRLAYPWLWWSSFELLSNFVVVIYYITIWKWFLFAVIIYAVEWCLSIYFIVVVYSYIKALREDPSGASVGFSPPLTGVNQTQMAGMAESPPNAASQENTV